MCTQTCLHTHIYRQSFMPGIHTNTQAHQPPPELPHTHRRINPLTYVTHTHTQTLAQNHIFEGNHRPRDIKTHVDTAHTNTRAHMHTTHTHTHTHTHPADSGGRWHCV